MELDLQSLFGLRVYSCTYWLRPGFRIPSGQRIRIRIRNPDPDPGGQKLPTEVEKI
jgi:hypothetical protein